MHEEYYAGMEGCSHSWGKGTEERTRSYPKNQPINCLGWEEFTIVEETYRYHRIRYRAKVDKSKAPAIESSSQPEKDRQQAL